MHEITIYGYPTCPHCLETVALIVDMGFTYDYKSLVIQTNRQEVVSLAEKHGIRKEDILAPVVMIDGEVLIRPDEEVLRATLS